MLELIKRFIKSLDFLKGTVLAIAMIVPVFISQQIFNNTDFGISIALGVLFCSPADVPGSKKHTFFGILVSIALVFSLTMLFGSIANILWLLIPLLGFFVFAVSFLSVFGFRASLISFAGLFAIVLSFVNDYNETNLFTHALLLVVGGFWYLSLSYLKSILFPRAETDQLFVKTMEKTAEFLKIRGELLICRGSRDELFHKLFELQSEINEQHETIRGIILSSRSKSGFSNSIRRQQLLFSELIDIFELAVANPLNYNKFDEVFKSHKEIIEEFKNLTFEMASYLQHISKVMRKEESLKPNNKLLEIIESIEKSIFNYRDSIGLPKSREGTLMLLNLKNYQDKQAQKIAGLERVFNNYSKNNKILAIKDANRFITPQDYDLKKLKENLSFKSPIFKHSLRLAIVILVGFVIGKLLSIQNPYWILLTIIVIMRPSYGLTKIRTKHRVFGTLIGGAIAIIIILITQNTIVYGVIAVVSLPLAFSLLQLNYRNAAVFITLNIVFVYAILEPDILSVIQFRIIDTMIGASLAFASNYLLWPSWEFQNIDEYFINAIKSNRKFLKQIDLFYHKKGEISTTYKLSRKDAFLAVGNLNGAFQRMSQDPKSKQKEVATIYDLIVIMNTLLSSSTSLGSFLRNNETSKVPPEFDVFVENISSNLEMGIQLLENNIESTHVNKDTITEAQSSYDKFFENLSNKRDEEIALGNGNSIEIGTQLKETHLVSEQVKWLFNLSEKLISSIKVYKSIL